MLTRRENLLVRPWQQRRYHNHRRKVESALPVIDVGPPAERGHVSCKLKQVQSEEERCAQIGRDNCALVLRLAHIMRTSRVDNVWRQPPPTFLRRVGIYLDPASAFPPPSPSSRPRSRPRTAAGRPSLRTSPRTSPSSAGSGRSSVDDGDSSRDSEGRNLRCSACHPRTALRRERRRETPAAAESAPTTTVAVREPSPEHLQAQDDVEDVVAAREVPPALTPVRKVRPPRSHSIPLDQVVITYKALRLAISFPPHASVRIRSARTTGGAPSDERRQRELRPVRVPNRTARTA
ncbi:hypothetical protein ONE63_004460 [Megalurothrips usitatus]|uniref:Serine/arginine repetitive matrix protein 1-like n=1 Tax=Megalurothrips usitatus TaxID=439358 RepID=A0AAV7X777_9NEOP|nr:hypothetical protein ONE63_004460 [Megalurothrips usitatus]